MKFITDGELSGIHGLYFGHYPQTSDGNSGFNNDPILWRVLDEKIDDGELFLLSEKSLDCRKYNEIRTGMTWEQSTIRAWLNGTSTKGGTPCTDYDDNDQAEQTFDYASGNFIDTAFSSGEQAAIATTSVKNKKTDDYTPNPYDPNVDGGKDTEDKIFLLSINDVQNGDYGFPTDYKDTPTREAKNTDYAETQGADAYDNGNCFWWLRSPGDGYRAAFVNGGGGVDDIGYAVHIGEFGVRPAFNLNLKSVIFKSAAEGGKSAAVGSGSLAAPRSGEYDDWKLTIKDEAHKNFTVNSVMTKDGKNLTVNYSGATSGSNEYISAIIKNKNGVIKYYGKLALASDEDGAETAINIDGKMSEGDTLCIFNEQCNGDYETDYSSPLKEVMISQATGMEKRLRSSFLE